MEKLEEKNTPKHVSWDYYPIGLTGSISGDRANEIIEEIISLLKKENITVFVAKQILEDTISSIDREAALDKML